MRVDTTADIEESASVALLRGLIDDAALFPPGSASMLAALDGFFANRHGRFSELQGAFVITASRLRELVALQEARFGEVAGEPMPLSVIIEYANLEEQLEDVSLALAAADKANVIAAFELRVPSALEAGSGFASACERLFALSDNIFVESSALPASADESARLAGALMSVASAGVRVAGAKIRTGGLEQNNVPSPALVAEFIGAMHVAGVSWKATAGLHHPVRGVYGGQTMHGFLNVLAATLSLHECRSSEARLQEILEETDPTAFRLMSHKFSWRDECFGTQAIARARRTAFRSFGSCSFEEPLNGLRDLHLL